MSARFLTVFESYRRADAPEVQILQRELRVRGMHTWRDVNDLPLGGATEAEILEAIKSKSDAFMLYATPALYLPDSKFIWEKELPAAADRCATTGYPIAVVFRGTTPDELSTKCQECGLPDLGVKANGIFVPLREEVPPDRDPLEHAIADAGRQMLRTLLDREHPTARASLSLILRTFETAIEADGLVLDLDWRGVLEGAHRRSWALLHDGLRDVADALRRASATNPPVWLQARLTACFGLGMELKRVSSIAPRVFAREGEWVQREGSVPFSPVTLARPAGQARVAVVTYGVIRKLGLAEEHLVARANPGVVLRFEVPEELAVHEHSRALASMFGHELRRLADAGVRHFHLIIAGPAGLAFLLGREANALGEIHFYFADGDREPSLAFSRAS